MMADYGICRADGCGKPAYTLKQGLCGMHAARVKRGGTLARRVEKRTFADLLDGRTRFGMWTVLREAEPYIRPDNNAGMRMAWCRCECGVERAVAAHILKRSQSSHCGCTRIAATIEAKTTHGMSYTPEHRTWSHMKERCSNPNNKDWALYGERGITVCD